MKIDTFFPERGIWLLDKMVKQSGRAGLRLNTDGGFVLSLQQVMRLEMAGVRQAELSINAATFLGPRDAR